MIRLGSARNHSGKVSEARSRVLHLSPRTRLPGEVGRGMWPGPYLQRGVGPGVDVLLLSHCPGKAGGELGREGNSGERRKVRRRICGERAWAGGRKCPVSRRPRSGRTPAPPLHPSPHPMRPSLSHQAGTWPVPRNPTPWITCALRSPRLGACTLEKLCRSSVTPTLSNFPL